MSGRGRRADEILGATVVLTGWSTGREADITEALGRLSAEPVDLGELRLPFVAIEKTSVRRAESARQLLEAAGGVVELRDAWVTREERPVASARPECPYCGSSKTQPYLHAGPGARKSMKCTTCGRTFKL
jgi:hypothetical protein